VSWEPAGTNASLVRCVLYERKIYLWADKKNEELNKLYKIIVPSFNRCITENFSGVFMGSPLVTIRVVGSRDPRDPMVDPPLMTNKHTLSILWRLLIKKGL
jgi:hypothetical protein